MKKRILVVDDNKQILQMLVKRLKQQNFEIETAESGNRALNMVKSKEYDLILLDQFMPEMDGLETFEKFKKIKNFDYPVIMLSVHGTIKLVLTFLKAGGIDFEEKPIDFDVLQLKIDRAIQISQKIQIEIKQRKVAEASLKKAHDELEKKVKDRTADLSKTNMQLKKQMAEKKRDEKKILNQLEELQRWHSVTLDREERILELKSEVNDLQVKLGKPLRYKLDENTE